MVKRLTMVKVQQQEGINDGGLFVCAFKETLTLGLDPSQYTFDQSLLRRKIPKFLWHLCPYNNCRACRMGLQMERQIRSAI